MVASLGAYAEFYGCLEFVAPGISELMMSAPCFWEAVACEPELHVQLAEKLGSAEIFQDALRHKMGKIGLARNKLSQREMWEELANALKSPVVEVKTFYERELMELTEITRELEHDLHRLQLFEAQAHDVSSYSACTGFLNAIGLKPVNRPFSEQLAEKSEYLARTTYGSWFAQELVGHPLMRSGSGKPRSRDSAR